MPSTEQAYMNALKIKMSEWSQTRTEEEIREIMKEFMFNETLYKEIVRTTMLTCGDVLSHDELSIKLGWVFSDIYTTMTLHDVRMSVFDACRCVSDTVKYKSNNVCYDLESAKQHQREIVDDANRRDAETPETAAGSEEESDDDEGPALSPYPKNEHKIQFSKRHTVTVPLRPASTMAMLLAKLASG